ncbi:flavin reductase family protein [Heyndrickxia acidicola]|uniref:Flavin reductase family protein n=1 Tax=Heyndrickxia acidicola TaxID=209389 RepID=A0ABU6MEP5_9BACI|nr:flavin reductase family protein [Heyndrickxia acidicola]MED1201737.1 flavin reductase family protein [Heyndrickxia acidicola]
MENRVFRDTMGKFATGITVVTTESEGNIHGMTVNSFMSVSLEPKLVAISIDEKASMHTLLPQTRKFTVSFLKDDQQKLSMIFAKQLIEETSIEFDRLDGQPVLKDALAAISCEVTDSLKAGDHTIFIGEVTGLTKKDGDPLLYFGGKYRNLEKIE